MSMLGFVEAHVSDSSKRKIVSMNLLQLMWTVKMYYGYLLRACNAEHSLQSKPRACTCNQAV